MTAFAGEIVGAAIPISAEVLEPGQQPAMTAKEITMIPATVAQGHQTKLALGAKEVAASSSKCARTSSETADTIPLDR
jgi:hypothetical protein